MQTERLRELSDATLVARALDGDSAAFVCVLKRYSGIMIGYAVKLTNSHADADDAVQEAWITAWQTLDTLRETDKLKSWLMRIVSRKAIDVIRKRRDSGELNEETNEAAGADPQTQNEINSQLDAASAVLRKLPELQRQTWVLKEMGGYSYQEIADELKLPLSTVRGNLARARKSLLVEMEVWK